MIQGWSFQRAAKSNGKRKYSQKSLRTIPNEIEKDGKTGDDEKTKREERENNEDETTFAFRKNVQ